MSVSEELLNLLFKVRRLDVQLHAPAAFQAFQVPSRDRLRKQWRD